MAAHTAAGPTITPPKSDHAHGGSAVHKVASARTAAAAAGDRSAERNTLYCHSAVTVYCHVDKLLYCCIAAPEENSDVTGVGVGAQQGGRGLGGGRFEGRDHQVLHR